MALKLYVTDILIGLTKDSPDKKKFSDYENNDTDLLENIIDDLTELVNTNPAQSGFTRIPEIKVPDKMTMSIVLEIEDLSSVNAWNKSIERTIVKTFEKWKAPYEIIRSERADYVNTFATDNLGGYYIVIGLGKKPVSTAPVKPQATTQPQSQQKPTGVTSSQSATTSNAYPGTVTKVGSKGKVVEKIQQRLNVKVDGIFGVITDRAVRRFQEDNDLVPDGIVGEKTWRKMFPPVAKVDTGSTISRDKLDPFAFSATSSINPNKGPLTYKEPKGKTSSQALKKTISSEFKKRVQQLGDKALSYGLDITKYLLPDEEVARNFIQELNPNLSPEDLNIMIYGTTYNPNDDILGNLKNFKQQIESAANNVKQTATNFADQAKSQADNLKKNLENNVQNAADTLKTNANNIQQKIQSDVKQNINNLSQQASQLANNEKLTQQFLSQLENVQKADIGKKKYTYEIVQTATGYEADVKYRRFDDFVISVGKKNFPLDFTQVIGGQTFSGKDAIEKSLSAEAITTGLFGYLKEQVALPNLPDKSEDNKKRIDAAREELESKFAGLKYGVTSSVDTMARDIADRYTDAAREKLHSMAEYSPYPLGKDSPLYKNVKEKKDELKKKINQFVTHQQDTFNALIATITQTTTAIPAIGILVSTPPFNLPAAISLATLVISAINELAAKVPPILDYITYLQNLVLYVSKDAYRELVRIMNPIVEVLLKILDPIALLKKFINKLLDAIKKLFSSQSCKKQLKRINRDIRRKEKQIKNEKDAEEKSDLEDELKDLKERKADVEKNCSKKPAFEQDLEDLNTILKSSDELSQKILSAVEETYVYDVDLPDGTRLIGISQEDVESLTSQYTVLFQ